MVWKLWMTDAEPEEQGSFCDTDSGHEYINLGDAAANIARDQAEDAGYSVEHMDEPFDGSPRRDSPSIDDRHNLFYLETDSQGSDMPAKYNPGR